MNWHLNLLGALGFTSVWVAGGLMGLATRGVVSVSTDLSAVDTQLAGLAGLVSALGCLLFLVTGAIEEVDS